MKKILHMVNWPKVLTRFFADKASPSLDSPFDHVKRPEAAYAIREASRYFPADVSRSVRFVCDEMLRVERTFVSERSAEARAVAFLGKLFGKPVFGKIYWRTLRGPNPENPNVEEALLLQLEKLVSRGETPCLPIRHVFLSVPMRLFKKTLAHPPINRELLAELKKAPRGPGGRACRQPFGRADVVDIVLTEKCGDATLRDYIASTKPGMQSDVFEAYLMLIHALSMFAKHGINHNDLHSRNVIVRRVPPVAVSLGGRRFVTTIAPFVVDWDLGRGAGVPNPRLADYDHVGIFDRENPLFDLFGLVKTFLFHRTHRKHPSPEMEELAELFSKLFETVRAEHEWLFEFEYHYEDHGGRVRTQRCVQQTPYIPARGSGRVSAKWPESVFEKTPSFEEIGDALYARVGHPLGEDEPVPEGVGGEHFFPNFFNI